MSDTLGRMEPGELELRKAFEQTTRGNINTMIAFCEDTRKMLRDTQDEVKTMKDLLMAKDTELNQLKVQVANLQQKIYSSGT
jgi:hypothetical protein